MHKLNKHSVINSILLLILTIIGFNHYYNNSKLKPDIVYINNLKLFNEFNMTKDIKIIEDAKINKQKKELDSLYVVFQNVTNKDDNSFGKLQQHIAHKSKVFQELQDNYKYNLSNTVWNRLNDYIKEYGLSNNLKIIIGAVGNGNIMYGKESLDITDELIHFSNSKYEGNK